MLKLFRRSKYDLREQRTTELAMIEHGWKLFPENTPDEEKSKRILQFAENGAGSWYPSGYVNHPVDVSGKSTTEDCRHNGIDHDGICEYHHNRFRRMWQRMDWIYCNRPRYEK